MLKEIRKYIRLGKKLREQIKETNDEKEKQELINELCVVYDKLEFLRGLYSATYSKERERNKKL